MHRRGIRGKYLTVYYHKYSGKDESTERFHLHPWRWAISFVFRGYYVEEIRPNAVADWHEYRTGRKRFSLKIHGAKVSHRIVYTKAGTRTLFIGLFRRQTPGPNATYPFKEGYGHYTEDRYDRTMESSPTQ